MKIQKYFKYSFLMGLGAFALSSCSDDIVVGSTENPDFIVPDGPVVYTTDADGRHDYTKVEVRGNGSVELTANSTRPAESPMTVQFAYDAAALNHYNAVNGTDYQAVPQSLVSLSNGGAAVIPTGATASEPMTVTITSDGTLESNKGYAVPLRITGAGSRAADGTYDGQYRVIFVKDLTSLPTAAKTVLNAEGVEVPAVRTMFCMEVNDMNPLNLLSYTLKNSGKMYYDGLMIFAANINYNPDTGRCYIHCNENVQALLDGYDHYLKPLQDRGIKVYLSILGNHDCSNLNNLDDDMARDYARQIKALCDAYGMDGVFYNSEYGGTGTKPAHGFVPASSAAGARLFYEVKKLQPERDNIIYTYDFYSLPDIDGHQCGDFMDLIWTNYGGGPINEANFPGVPRFNLGHYSWEFTQGRTSGDLKSLRDGGYGLHVHFGNTTRLSAMQSSCATLYDDELVYDGKFYPKDWI